MRLSFEKLVSSFHDGGLSAGETVMVQSSLLHIGPVEGVASRGELAEFYYNALREVIGREGTVVVLTPFEDYGRFNIPFDVENTSSTAGILSEYVRTLPGAVRSSHPITSLAAVGPKAGEICRGNHYEGFGWDSPFGRLHRSNSRFLTLGLGLAMGLTFLHYVEALYGVPYKYTKHYATPVYHGKAELPARFTMNVRYLDFSVRFDYKQYENRMIESGVARQIDFERGLLFQTILAEDAFEGGVQCLAEDPYIFLACPPRFRAGEIPIDGETGEFRWVYHEPRQNQNKSQTKNERLT